MACLGARTSTGIAGNTSRVKDRVRLSGQVTIPFKQCGKYPPSTTLTIRCSSIEKIKDKSDKTSIGNEHEKFDRWMKESVETIVKNLQEAPLFVHVYGGDEPNTILKTEKAIREEWVDLKGKWVKGLEPPPEGVILVEELKEGKIGMYEEFEGQNGNNNSNNTKAWGVLIQGKGENEGVGCYLLKTSRVRCGNLGLLSTHYCLVKVSSFRDSVRSQLTNCWLV